MSRKLVVRIVLLSCLTSLLVGWQICKPRDRRNLIFRVDSSFTSWEIERIGNAIGRWNSAGNLNISYYVDKIPIGELITSLFDGKHTIYNGRLLTPLVGTIDSMIDKEMYTAGIAICQTGDIIILEFSEQVVTHEIGHILLDLMWHSKNPRSIMYREMIKGQVITEEELTRLMEKL